MYLNGVFSLADTRRRPVSHYSTASSSFFPPPQAYPSGFSSHPVNPPSKPLNDDNQINPSIVLIIIILTVIFFLSAFLHVLIRYFARAPNRDSNSPGGIGAIEGQLQQLFHLHDSGIEQAFIDALPVFLYKAVKGLKEGSDCAICLHEFQAEDKLRLLPKCSHAFHLECIDTWLLSHSTCPLCRESLLQYFSNLPPAGPGFTFESGDESRDTEADEQSHLQDHLPFCGDTQQPGINQVQSQAPQNPEESLYKSWPQVQNNNESGKVMIMPIKLGKFRNIADCKKNETRNVAGSSRDIRRCYSMGSYEYAIDPSNLEVVIAIAPCRRQTAIRLPLTPGHRHALSECTSQYAEMSHSQLTPSQDFVSESRTLIKANQSHTWRDGDAFVDIDLESEGDRTTEVNERMVEISNSSRWFKINTGGQPGSVDKLGCSRRAFSFRLGVSDDVKPKQSGGNRRSLSETEVFAGWKDDANLMAEAKTKGNLNVTAPIPDREDSNSDYTSTSEANASFGMRTIHWLVGRQKRVVPPSASATWYVAEQK